VKTSETLYGISLQTRLFSTVSHRLETFQTFSYRRELRGTHEERTALGACHHDAAPAHALTNCRQMATQARFSVFARHRVIGLNKRPSERALGLRGDADNGYPGLQSDRTSAGTRRLLLGRPSEAPPFRR